MNRLLFKFSHIGLRPGVGFFLGWMALGLVLVIHASATPPIPPSEMVAIPGGHFTMGNTEEGITWAAQTFFSESLDYYRDETPAHPVNVPAFEIDKTEVTFGQYLLYAEQQGIAKPKFADNTHFNGPFQPVVGVTWQEAVKYCQSLGKRLPTEAEWEFAARGMKARPYPWGKQPDEALANVRGRKDGFRYSSPLGRYPQGASQYGVLDLAGNVWEWTADWYQPYPGNTTPNDLYGEQFKVIRGGSWFSNMDLARTTVRGKSLPDQRMNYIGFRCAR